MFPRISKNSNPPPSSGCSPKLQILRISILGVAQLLQKYAAPQTPKSLPLDRMNSVVLQLFALESHLEDARPLLDFVAHASSADTRILSPWKDMWPCAIRGPHLELFLHHRILPLGAPHRHDFPPPLSLGPPSLIYPLHSACSLERWDAVKLLIPHVPPYQLTFSDSSGWTPLSIISKSSTISHVDWATIVQLFKETHVDLRTHRVNRVRDTVLHILCRLGKVAAVQTPFSLIDGFDCSVRNARGHTPLHVVCRSSASTESQSIVRLLLKHGADASARTPSDETALHYACSSGYPASVVEDLCASLSSSECINHRDCAGDTPLHAFLGIHRRKSDPSEVSQVVRELFKAGADPNVWNYRGMIPLHSACMPAVFGLPPHFEVIEALLEPTRDVNDCTKLGNTPLDILISLDSEKGGQMIEWLRERGAKLAWSWSGRLGILTDIVQPDSMCHTSRERQKLSSEIQKDMRVQTNYSREIVFMIYVGKQNLFARQPSDDRRTESSTSIARILEG